MEEYLYVKYCLIRENIIRLEESVLCIIVIYVFCVLYGMVLNDIKLFEMVLYYKCLIFIYDVLNVVGVDCVCVEIFIIMFIMLVFFLFCNLFF